MTPSLDTTAAVTYGGKAECPIRVYLNEPMGRLHSLHGINYPHNRRKVDVRIAADHPEIDSVYARRYNRALVTAQLYPGDEKHTTDIVYESVNASRSPRSTVNGIELCFPRETVLSGDPDLYLASFAAYETVSRTLKRAFPFLPIGAYAAGDFSEMLDSPDPAQCTEAYFFENFLKYFAAKQHRAPLDFFSAECLYGSIPECKFFTEYIVGKLSEYGFRDTELILSSWNARGRSDYDCVSFLREMNTLGVRRAYLSSCEDYTSVVALYNYMYRRRGIAVYSEHVSEIKNVEIISSHADYRTLLLIANRGRSVTSGITLDASLPKPYLMRISTFTKKLYSGDYSPELVFTIPEDSVILVEIYRKCDKDRGIAPRSRYIKEKL